MTLIAYLHTAVMLRIAELRGAERDRGDSPVPTAVIIMGLVVVAMAVTALAMGAAEGWMDKIPEPADPAAPPED